MMNKKIWTAPAALQTAVVAMAMCVFPLEFVDAQDFEAVERRLGGAVEAGELSLGQANLMMETLRRSHHESHEMQDRKHRYMQFTQEIETAVEAGKLSQEEAEKKRIAVRREMFEQDAKRHELEAKKRRYEQAAREIKEAHEAGKISEQDAEKKLIAMRRKIFAQDYAKAANGGNDMETQKRNYRRAAKEIEAAVKAGKVNREDAETRLIEMRKAMFGDDR